ncbi:MarR family winged helix-turn-helix transcriptional regulator [Fodinicola acaciae]|uniref:MarR family winged helix-turn-helix transcriptional regulator n=1 Tax=Fodinicola acaciae TaxID=2681555 RepID=UPI0013D1553B|nr:MarR family transcriptional regulator [Fodinicola acaciae]
MSKQVRAELITEIQHAVAHFQHLNDLFDAAAAELFGVNRTDLLLIGLLGVHGPQTAGELAAGASLSPAATTTAIDRIVRAGHAVRRRGEHDKRQTVVVLTPGAEKLTRRIYSTIADEGREQLEEYSDRDLRVIHGFLLRGHEVLERNEKRLRAKRGGDLGA